MLRYIFVNVRLCSSTSKAAIKMAGGNKNKLSREEELLLQDFSRNVSTKSSALFYGNALIVSAIPICEFCRKTIIIYQSFQFTCYPGNYLWRGHVLHCLCGRVVTICCVKFTCPDAVSQHIHIYALITMSLLNMSCFHLVDDFAYRNLIVIVIVIQSVAFLNR